MQVTVNGEEVEIFEGARLENVIMKYSMAEYEKIEQGEKIVQDKWGNKVNLSGELTGREEFQIVKK